MKIFATRKKRKPVTTRTHDKSDPIVEELLKKSSSEWNAKERRMVKRYHERKAKESGDETSNEPISITEEKTEKGNLKHAREDEDEVENGSEDNNKCEESSEQDVNCYEDSNNDDSIDTTRNDDDSDNTTNETKTIVENTQTLKNEAPNDVMDDASLAAQKIDDADGDGMVNKDHRIWKVLDTLNSKQKRTYTRKLNRMGSSVLDEVEKEVQSILDGTMDKKESDQSTESLAVKTNINHKSTRTEIQRVASTDALQPNKKKQKKNGSDWSSLPAEERLRREEQRTKQLEAAQRRARGEAIAPGHKRPLNSARRRANRRKPKWNNKSTVMTEKQEHHSSGYHHRHGRSEEPTNVNNY